MGVPLVKLAMVWLVEFRLWIVIAWVTVLGIQTLSVETGTAPLLQFAAVAH